MSGYMTAVIVCAAAASLCNLVAPKDGPAKRYIKYISGLVTLCVLASPILNANADEFSLPSFDAPAGENASLVENFHKSIIERAESTLSDEILRSIADEFEFADGDASVDAKIYADFDGGDSDNPGSGSVRLESIVVTLRGNAVWCSAEALSAYIERNYDCEVQIRYE